MSQFDFVGFGALNVDKLFKADKIAGREEESFVMGYHESCGGSAANTTVGLARLGLKTGFVGKVADDREGRFLLEDFKRESVDTRGIVLARGGQSGLVMGFVDKKGDRALYVAPGVNDTLDRSEISLDYVEIAQFLHLTSFAGEKSFDTQKKLVQQLSDRVRVSFDPGRLYADRGLTALGPILKRAYAVLPNEAELKILSGKNRPEEGAKTLIAEGAEVVGVKMGDKGCFVTDGKQGHTIAAFKVRVVDTTGAGDAWNAGFLYGLLKKRGLHECGKIGNLVASRCIMKMGARTGLPRLAELKVQEL
jgi:ribokinase